MTRHKTDLFTQRPWDWLSQTAGVASPSGGNVLNDLKGAEFIYFLITFSDGVSASM